MRFCKYCGYQISENVKICQRCGKNIEKRNENKNVNKKRIAIIGIMVAVVIMIVCVINIGRCDAKKCNNKAISGMHYCYAHKCVINNCDNEKSSYSNYCYSHYLIYDDDAVSSYAPKVYSYQLKISNVTLSSNSSYSIAEGSITNNSEQTVSYVKIKGAFKNQSGTVIDTDWTYAVGSEGLAPGESCTWRMSVKKNHNIDECVVSILDFDY